MTGVQTCALPIYNKFCCQVKCLPFSNGTNISFVHWSDGWDFINSAYSGLTGCGTKPHIFRKKYRHEIRERRTNCLSASVTGITAFQPQALIVLLPGCVLPEYQKVLVSRYQPALAKIAEFRRKSLQYPILFALPFETERRKNQRVPAPSFL